jgi:hypothetical protein
MGISLVTDPQVSEIAGKIITLVVTAASMSLAFTLIPLFPSPLPFIVAALVAYSTYRNPPIGAFTGSMIILLGLFYHLSRIGFFELFPGPWMRLLTMVVLIVPFFILPPMLSTNISIIAMDIGIIAVSLLFFTQTFYLAVPLILIFATVYNRRGIIVTISYYAAISLPLQLMQYLKTFSAGLPPPLYAPLNLIFNDIQEAMKEVSLSEIYKIFNTIGGQLLVATRNGGVIDPAIASFIDSLPGMLMFIIIISALISVTALISLKLPEPLKNTKLPRRYEEIMIYTIPTATASFTNVAFFALLWRLEGPLAYDAMVDQTILLLSTAFTIILSTPVSLSRYFVDIREVLKNRMEETTRKAEELLYEIESYVGLIEKPRGSRPLSFMALRTKMLVVADELRDILSKLSADPKLKDVDENMRRVFTQINSEVTNFKWQLGVAIDDHIISTKYEYLEAEKEIKEMGLAIKAPVILDPPEDASVEDKIACIGEYVEAGGFLVEELIFTSDRIWEIIHSLFEPNLPGVSPILQISREDADKDDPWIIIDAIISSLKNWEKQYSAEIERSTQPIKDSVETIIELSKREYTLLPILGDRFYMIKELAGELEVKDFSGDDADLKVLRVILIRDTILATVDVVARVIGILYDHLKDLEKTIDGLMPLEDYEWNKNLTLIDRMNASLEVINDYGNREINEIISHLYRILSYIDEAVDTIEYYNERRELLLNYAILEKKIDRILSKSQEVRLKDLGVSEKYGREYLKLYLRSHSKEAFFEEVGDTLRRIK